MKLQDYEQSRIEIINAIHVNATFDKHGNTSKQKSNINRHINPLMFDVIDDKPEGARRSPRVYTLSHQP